MSIYDIYVPLLVHSAAVVLASEYSLFETVETILIQNIVHTEYWPAMFSSDLWIIIMRSYSQNILNNENTCNDIKCLFFIDIYRLRCVTYNFQN